MADICRVVDLTDVRQLDGAACAFGVFDGIHLGHQLIINGAIEAACNQSDGIRTKSAILTFDIDPDEILGDSNLRKIMSNEDRLDALSRLDVDHVIVLTFTKELASLDPWEFLEELFGVNQPSSIHIGSDFRFGACARGDIGTLKDWATLHSTEVDVYDLLQIEDKKVSSTRIRNLLKNGDVKGANMLMGRNYSFSSEVLPGRKQGRQMGFRTANLHLAHILRVLGDGVYGGYAYVDGIRYKAAISVGISPTFEDEVSKQDKPANVEVHILGIDRDIYGQTVKIEPVEYLRPMIKFDSTDKLIATVKDNIAWIDRNL